MRCVCLPSTSNYEFLFRPCFEVYFFSIIKKMSSPAQKPNDRLRRAKSEISHNRISTQTLRTEFRARFFNRLRTTRSKSVDRFRQIVEDYEDSIGSINDIRKLLLQVKEGASILESEEVNELLNLIERELAQINICKENDDHVKNIEKQDDDTVNRLLNTCQGCEKLCDTDICSHCVNLFSHEFN